MCGGIVEIEKILFYVFPMVARTVPRHSWQTEKSLFDDAIFPVPKCRREAKLLVIVGEAKNPILAPSMRVRARVIV